MSRERRVHERRSLDAVDMSARFAVQIDGSRHEFHKVSDVSISGMGLVLPVKVEIGAQVTLNFSSEDLNLELNGEVIWSEAESDNEAERHRVGVRFDTQNVDHNVLFFMSVREYLDTFDQH